MANTNPIISEVQFKYNPELVSKYGTYKNYIAEQLKTTSAWTVAKEYSAKKDAEKDAAEIRYYESLAIMKNMEKQEYIANNKLENALNNYGENSFRYTDAKKNYVTSIKNTSDAETNWKIAMDAFNSANTSAFKAYLNSAIADSYMA